MEAIQGAMVGMLIHMLALMVASEHHFLTIQSIAMVSAQNMVRRMGRMAMDIADSVLEIHTEAVVFNIKGESIS